MRGRDFGNCHRPMAVLGKIVLLGMLSFLIAGCEVVSPPFPKGFVRIPSKLDAWENQGEGFRLVLVSNNARVQGFFEWEAQGLYGRIVEAGADGNVRTLSLGDGGMDGLRLTAVVRGASVEVHYKPPALKEVTVRGKGLKAAESLRILAAQYTTQEGGHSTSLRLQYLGARQKTQVHVFDEVLRRGKSPYQMAAFRQAQQESAPLNVYQGSSGQPQPSIPPLEYEEIEYPVFISDSVVSVATQHYLFNGGAHGAASTAFDVIDRKTGVRLGPGDIFSGDDWKTELSSLLKAELVRQSDFRGVRGKAVSGTGVSGGHTGAGGNAQAQIDLRTLGFFEPDIKPSENIFVCGSGIGFEYDRYQIAPWYMGEFILVLPWSAVKPYLNPALLSGIMPL